MKKELIIPIVVVIILLLGFQTYMLFHMSERVNALCEVDNNLNSLQSQTPNSSPKVADIKVLKPILHSDFFRDQSWNPYEEMQHMQYEMEQLFGESFSRFHMNTPSGTLVKIPEANLQETPDLYVITMNAPGADVSSANAKLEEGVVHITVKTEHEEEDKANEKEGKYRFRERFAGEFHRAITLPGPANGTKIETIYKNGILTIKIPKK